MTAYHVTVTREGRYWVAVVPGLAGGATETRALSALEDEVRDLVSGLTDVDPDSLELDFDYRPALGGPAQSAVHNVNELRLKLRRIEGKYTKAQGVAIERLKAAGVSVRDTAQLLGLSSGRISQLHPDANHGRPAARALTTRRGAPPSVRK